MRKSNITVSLSLFLCVSLEVRFSSFITQYSYTNSVNVKRQQRHLRYEKERYFHLVCVSFFYSMLFQFRLTPSQSQFLLKWTKYWLLALGCMTINFEIHWNIFMISMYIQPSMTSIHDLDNRIAHWIQLWSKKCKDSKLPSELPNEFSIKMPFQIMFDPKSSVIQRSTNFALTA